MDYFKSQGILQNSSDAAHCKNYRMLQVWRVMRWLCFSVHWGRPGSQLGFPVIVLSTATATYPVALFSAGLMAWGGLLIMVSEDRSHVGGDKV